MYLEMKLKQAKLDWCVLDLRFPKNSKKNLLKGKEAGCSFCLQDIETKARYADIFKPGKQEKS